MRYRSSLPIPPARYTGIGPSEYAVCANARVFAVLNRCAKLHGEEQDANRQRKGSAIVQATEQTQFESEAHARRSLQFYLEEGFLTDPDRNQRVAANEAGLLTRCEAVLSC